MFLDDDLGDSGGWSADEEDSEEYEGSDEEYNDYYYQFSVAYNARAPAATCYDVLYIWCMYRTQ